MDTQTVWLLLLSLATPIAGVVGFAIQIRQVKKARLENEKLQLEIAALRVAQAQLDKRIVSVTTEEVIRYNDLPMASRTKGPNPGPDLYPPRSSYLASALVVSLLIFLLAYAAYDFYRAFRWLAKAL